MNILAQVLAAAAALLVGFLWSNDTPHLFKKHSSLT